MKIADVTVQHFRYRSRVVRDSEGHGHPGPEHAAVNALLTISTDEGAHGHYIGAVDAGAIANLVKPLLLGENPFHYYSRLEALELVQGLEQLRFLWLEEPMDEHSMSSYVWLCEQTSLPICGPETAEGKMFARAEWIRHGACDMVRGGVGDVGGIIPLVKIAHLAEAFGMKMEVHGNGVGNLHVLCAMASPGRYYERGLLHPFIDDDATPAWLNEPVDPMDEAGFVHVSPRPGLGLSINFDYIRDNLVAS